MSLFWCQKNAWEASIWISIWIDAWDANIPCRVSPTPWLSSPASCWYAFWEVAKDSSSTWVHATQVRVPNGWISIPAVVSDVDYFMCSGAMPFLTFSLHFIWKAETEKNLPQMPIIAEAGSDQSRESRSQSKSPTWVAKIQIFQSYRAAILGAYRQETGIRSEAACWCVAQLVQLVSVMPASHVRTWSFSAAYFQSSSLLTAWEKQQRMVQILGPMPPTWETQQKL